MFWCTQEQLDQWQVLQEKREALEVSLCFDGDDLFKSIKIKGDFTLTSGKKSNYFYDFERMTPNYMTFVSGILHERIKDHCEFEFVVGPAYGGIIPGYCVADFAQKEFVAFNPRTGSFRGNVKTMAGRFIIVDDVISSYQTVDKTIAVISEKHPSVRCVGTACFVFRGEKVREGGFRTFYLHRGEVEL